MQMKFSLNQPVIFSDLLVKLEKNNKSINVCLDGGLTCIEFQRFLAKVSCDAVANYQVNEHRDDSKGIVVKWR